jgi:hypothetical protein
MLEQASPKVERTSIAVGESKVYRLSVLNLVRIELWAALHLAAVCAPFEHTQ